jgi:hypothetical protein
MKGLPNEQRKRLYVIAGIAAGMLLGIWVGPIGMLNDHLVRTKRMIQEQEDKLNNGQRLVNEKKAIEANLLSASNYLQTLEHNMPSGDLYAWMYQTVNRFRTNYRVEIPQISRETAGEVGMFPAYPYRAATFSLQGSAQFHDLGRFVADFENTFPHMRLQNLELEPSGAETKAAAEVLRFKMDVVSLINPNP